MYVKNFPTKDEASSYLAHHIVERINAFNPTSKNPFVIGLPTGSSPEGIYAKLIEYYKKGAVSFENVVSFNMDEYVGLAKGHTESYHYFMYEKLFDHINMKPENINILDGMSEDIEAECSKYEEKIKSYGRIHLFLGGLGPEGHIAFNERGSTRDSITRKVKLENSTIDANCRFFDNDTEKVPKFALSVGISTILDNSNEVCIIVLGSGKKHALNNTIHGPISSEVPSSFLRDHDNVTIVCDDNALGVNVKATL